MTQLPPSAAKLLERARQEDRSHHVDTEAALASLHAVLPFTDVSPALSLADGAQGEGAGGILQPDLTTSVGVPTSGTSGAWLAGLTGKLVKVFLAAITLGGAVGGASLLYTQPQAVRTPAPRSAGQATPNAASAFSLVGTPQRQNEAQQAMERATVAAPSPAPTLASAPDIAPRSATRTARGATRSSRIGAAQPKKRAPVVEAPQGADAEPTRQARPETPPATPPNAAQPATAELDLIDAALGQLNKGAQARALALLAEHAQLYPSGKFSTERQGLRVLALCASGQLEQGLAEQARFLSSDAKAPIAARVRGACRNEEPRE
jgi:hypothetical protein